MTPADPSPLPSQRHLFDIPDDVAFLNCAYMSPLPKASVAAGARGLARKMQPWTIAPADFFTASEAVRARFAQLVNAAPDDVAFAPAVSYGMAQAAANIALKKTQRVVTLAEQLPSNFYPCMDLAARAGAKFISVPRPADGDWTAALLAAIDAATGVVAVPHCHWTDGGLIDLEKVGAACRRVGAVFCVDGTQSVGALPFDVKRIDPYYLAVASYKWLLGPYSFGFLYVAPRRQGERPIEHNWIARRGSRDLSADPNIGIRCRAIPHGTLCLPVVHSFQKTAGGYRRHSRWAGLPLGRRPGCGSRVSEGCLQKLLMGQCSSSFRTNRDRGKCFCRAPTPNLH